MFVLSRIAALLADILASNQAILKAVRLRTPGLVFLSVRKEKVGDKIMSICKLRLPTPGAADVVARKLTISVAGGDPQQFDLPGDALESSEFEASQGDGIVGQLVDIDDASPTPNESEPRTFELTVADTIAPPQPGEIAVVMVSE